MEIVVLLFFAFLAFIGFAPKELTKVCLVGVWVLMAGIAIIAPIWSVLR